MFREKREKKRRKEMPWFSKRKPAKGAAAPASFRCVDLVSTLRPRKSLCLRSISVTNSASNLTPPPHKNNKNTNQENNCTAYCAHHVRVKEHGEEKRRRRKKEEKRRKREGDFIKHFPFPAYCTYPFFSIASIRNRSRSFFA